MGRIDIRGFQERCGSIYDFYELATIGLQHPETMEKKVKSMIRLMQTYAKDEYFLDGKAPPKEFWESSDMIKLIKGQTEEKIKFALCHIKNQCVVMFHSYIELIMGSIVGMILEKDVRILKRVYNDREKGGYRLSASKIIDSKDNIISIMIENEVERFTRKSMKEKESYFKKYFDLSFKWSKSPQETDIFEIDNIRHDIIHGKRSVVVDDYKLLVINNYINGLGFHLLANARIKFQIDVVWTDGLGRNYLR